MDHHIYVMLDPVHMIKLARNALGSIRRIKSADGVINYDYIEDLVAHQEDMGLRLVNKLSKRHLNWVNMKMKVIVLQPKCFHLQWLMLWSIYLGEILNLSLSRCSSLIIEHKVIAIVK
jgi:hypothetical protein